MPGRFEHSLKRYVKALAIAYSYPTELLDLLQNPLHDSPRELQFHPIISL